MENVNNHKVVCFGEVLWDIFPSGSIPGSAPMNVAYHLYKQQKNPALISRRLIKDKFKIKNIVVTMGGEGAILFYNGNGYLHKGFKVDKEPVHLMALMKFIPCLKPASPHP